MDLKALYIISSLYLTAALEDELGKLNLSPEISNFILSEQNPQIKGLLFNKVKNLPGISFDDVINLHSQIKDQLSQKKSRKIQATDPDIIEIANTLTNSSIIHWWTNIVNNKQTFVKDLKNQNRFDKNNLIEILRKIEHFYIELPKDKKYNDIYIDLGQINFQDMTRLAQEWESSFYKPSLKNELKQENIVFRFENGYFIVELKTKTDLQEEGSKLNHCVGGYFTQIESGQSRIFSLRQPNNTPEITIETDPSLFNFYQTLGKSNAQPNTEQSLLINIWKQSLHSTDKILRLANSNNIYHRIQAITFMDYRNPEFKDVMDNLLLDAKPSIENFLTSQVANNPRSEFQAFAGNPTLPENLYEFIYDNDNQNISTIFLLASNNSIGSKLFERLLQEQDQDIIRACLFSRKIANYPDIIREHAKNQDFLKIILNNPSIKSSLTRELIKQYGDKSLFDNPNVLDPKFLNDWIEVNRDNPKMIVLALTSNNLREEDFDTIAKRLGVSFNKTDNYIEKQYKLFSSGSVFLASILLPINDEYYPPELLTLEDHGKRLKHSYILYSRNCPPEVLLLALKDKDENVRAKAASNPNCPPEGLLLALQDKSEDVRAKAAGNPNCPPEGLLLTIQDKDEHIRYTAAGNPNCPPEGLLLALKDKDENVRHRAAGNLNCPPEVLLLILQNQDENIRKIVASNPNCPPEGLLLALQDNSEDVRAKAAGNPNCPKEGLLLATQEYNAEIRYEALCNPNYPKEQLLLSIQNGNKLTRQYAAQNPSCPPEGLLLALKDKDEHIRYSAVSNPNCPPEGLLLVIQDKGEDQDILLEAIRNPNCPTEGLLFIIKSNWFVLTTFLEEIINNPNCPPEGLLLALQDKDEDIRNDAAGNPNCPPEGLLLALKDKLALIRARAAGNPSCPPEGLLLAIQDEDVLVILDAIRNPNFPLEGLLLTLKSDNGEVLKATREKIWKLSKTQKIASIYDKLKKLSTIFLQHTVVYV